MALPTRDKIKIAVIGLGYVGLPLAIALAKHFPLTGFDISRGRVAELAQGRDRTDEVPEEVETRCKPGDLWILGNHRLLCGDSTNPQHADRLMNGVVAEMMFTDPPYEIGRAHV